MGDTRGRTSRNAAVREMHGHTAGRGMRGRISLGGAPAFPSSRGGA